MNIYYFLSQYDFTGAIVFLEGKRTVKSKDQELLIRLGRLLAFRTKNIVF